MSEDRTRVTATELREQLAETTGDKRRELVRLVRAADANGGALWKGQNEQHYASSGSMVAI